ncbi:MAG: twin-arginine translocase TatA/TatE family subunit [Actinomycetota bacterium]|nr:twin-arginine translocase TatA/TatE family subunit [Actinomycetota bacterium]
MTGAIFGLGPLEFVLILVIVIVLFLPSLLPKLVKRMADTFGSIREMTDKTGEKEEEKGKQE